MPIVLQSGAFEQRMRAPVRRGPRTSIFGAILFAMQLFEQSPYPRVEARHRHFGRRPEQQRLAHNAGSRRGTCKGHRHHVTIKEREKFKEAIRAKLLLEVAGRTPKHRVVPVAEKEPRISCTIGEKTWQDRWGR
jgi:hypothetical protein